MKPTPASHTAPPAPRWARLAALWLARGALLALALWLGAQAWQRNLAEACWLDEWPRLGSCTPLAQRPQPEQVAALRERVARNPGDSHAWVALATLAQTPGGAAGVDAAAVLATAARLAPNDSRVLRLQARQALQAQDWPTLVAKLVPLAQFHNSPEAATALGALVQDAAQVPALATALNERLRADAGWLSRALHAMAHDKRPLVLAMPLVSQAIAQGQLSPELGQFVMHQLKAQGHWVDAYAVWLALWKKPLGLLFNGDFEQPFVPHGFDWEVIDTQRHRAGARVNLVGRGERGQVLQVVLTGREMQMPLLRQHLVLPPGLYRFSGEFQSTELRSAQGLAWVLSCAKDGQELARTPPIRAQGRSWQALELAFTVPTDCGAGVELALRTQAPFEARAGVRGEVLFDRFALVAAPEQAAARLASYSGAQP
jgi:hypothetical protein